MDYLTSAGHEIPDLMGLLGEVATAVRLGVKPWFAEVGLSTIDTFWACCLFF